MMWKKLFPLFLVVFNLILSDVAKPASMDKMCKYSQFQQVSNRSGIEAKSPSSIIFRRFGSLVDVSGKLQFGESPSIFRSLKISS